MLTKNQQLWVEALRSEEYKQTKGTLENGEGLCCLGVACRVYEKDTGNNLDRNALGHITGDTLCEQCEVKEWVGLRHGTGSYLNEDTIYNNLTNLNDGGLSFLQIADVIESAPKELLV